MCTFGVERMEQKRFIITKKIASQGKRAVILIPALLRENLRPSTVVRVTIDIIKEAESDRVIDNE